MKITRITAWQKTLPLTHPYWLSGGRLKFEALDSTFVRIDTDEGVSGWGEGCPWGSTYLPAHGGGIRAALPLLCDALIDEDPGDIERLNRAMNMALPGHGYAKSPLDMALWDIAGKVADKPLYQLLGGAEGTGVPVNSSISTGTPEEMVALIETARAEGYRTHSAKVGGTNYTLDIQRIEAIEACRQNDEHITFDVNRAWTPAAAIKVMNSVQSSSWFEQPCQTLDQCLKVRLYTTQPIMLDECMMSFEDHLLAWKMNGCEGVKVKPNRLGGISACRQVRDFGVSVGWQMHIEDVGGTVLADTAALHLAYSTPEENRLASWLCQHHLVDDPAPGQGARNVAGMVTLNNKPGLGVSPDENWLGEVWQIFQ
ncbi:MAG: L-alanine-DL-glutamate epimerase-like enolase superfamily enzyme [Parasphingorhabdus sp.]|jgi:L-alanine-DL-glutamate epimerase-like enolase superfamily enzyme